MPSPSGLQDGRDELHFWLSSSSSPHRPTGKDIWVRVSKTNKLPKEKKKPGKSHFELSRGKTWSSQAFFLMQHYARSWQSDGNLTTKKKRSSRCPEPLTSLPPPGVPESCSEFSAGPCDRRPALQASLKANHDFFIQLTRVHLLGSEGKVSGETTSGEEKQRNHYSWQGGALIQAQRPPVPRPD